ncbi:hypothetical protein OI25_6112 [Paraburkholderia fungorum]|uniref:Uncharacterized protein n=1 Tax=Paraburkholderia fungorum TaxID=134537 RepID=A0AAU8TD11_9BURK|nr:hypothetical protein [Paraburkholderia fungorum]AJZ64172.1 hypothetical protein OI25_6112 [Paraburkholderia fungorum]
MTNKKIQSWPKGGFENFFEYVSSYIHLNINLDDDVSCRRYHDEWMGRYKSAIEKWTRYDVTIWSVRCRQALKLSFSATYFALAAKEAQKNKVLASKYYLSYYSMLHAMWAVLFLHPDLSLDAVTDITHSKIANFFHASFTQKKKGIITYNAKEMAENLRFMREYYSYRMPLNYPFGRAENISKTDIHLGGFVKQSIQLANLHSHILRKAAEKQGMSGAACVPSEQHDIFRRDFFRINGKEHPTSDLNLLDPADSVARDEYLTRGCDLVPLSIGYEHMYDEFMTYADGGDELPENEIIRETRSLVYGALF